MNKLRVAKIALLVAFICLTFLMPVILKSLYWIHVLILTMITVLMAVSLRALSRTGQISIGTAGFMLLGAYASGLLSVKLGLSVWLTLPIGALVAALIATALGYPFLRAKGIYFAILTVMMAEVFRLVAWYWSSLTAGNTGLRNIPPPNPIHLFGLTLSFTTKIEYYYLTLIIVIISLFILYRIERSWLGLMWSSINEADNLAQAVGINIMGHKMLIFVISSFFIGLAGALYAHYMGTISPYGTPGSPFGFTNSVYILIYMVVGGATSFAGPIVGAVIFTLVPELARGMQEYLPLIFGALLIFVVFVVPDGIIGIGKLLPRLFNRTKSALQGSTPNRKGIETRQ
jgi:branched-chain amino acid transport system permease protein